VLEGMIAVDYAVGLFAMLHCQHTTCPAQSGKTQQRHTSFC